MWICQKLSWESCPNTLSEFHNTNGHVLKYNFFFHYGSQEIPGYNIQGEKFYIPPEL